MPHYLDHNATTQPLAVALKAQAEAAASAFGNPSSLHWAGRAARRMLDDARDLIAARFGIEAGSVVFTSGGTEADNMAIFGTLAGAAPGRIVATAIEHPAVLLPLEFWQQRGFSLQLVRPGSDGVVALDAMRAAIDSDTRLVCMMLANNETGALQPVHEVARHCRALGVPLLVDAVQALGKIPFTFADLDADFVALSAHKIGGPKGVGALLVRKGRQLQPLLAGGGQERKRRSGTENLPAIAGFAAALKAADFSEFTAIRDHFEARLLAELPEAVIFAQSASRLGNTSMFGLPGMDGETLLMQLDLAGFAVASGSACSSGKRDPSHVLLAMGVARDLARGSLRISFGPGNSLADAEALVAELVKVRSRLRRMAGLE